MSPDTVRCGNYTDQGSIDSELVRLVDWTICGLVIMLTANLFMHSVRVRSAI